MSDSMIDEIEIEDEKDIESETASQIPREVRKLRTQPYDKSIIDLIGMIDRGDIILKPDFQRNSNIWDNKRSSLLIESIWLNIPIPQIFVSVEDDGKWNVIDGQQRLTALNKFFKNEFSLRGLEVLHELNNQTYEDLDEKPKRLLNGGTIRIISIHEDSHPDIKFDVFMRINQGAIQLNAQELRNCLYRGDLNKTLHQMVKNPQLKNILRLEEPHNRFKDAEMVLRYLAISKEKGSNFDNYPGVMKEFLNSFMRSNKKISPEELEELQSKFQQNLAKVYIVFGENSFRKWDEKKSSFDKSLNLSIMDCQMIALEKYTLEQIQDKKDSILTCFKEIFSKTSTPDTEEAAFLNSISNSTSSKRMLSYRLSYLEKKFAEIFQHEA